MDISLPDIEIKDLSALNVIIGKNGSGKSTLLRKLDAHRDNWTHVKYISPERGGRTLYEPSVDANVLNNKTWLDETRRQNHDDSFRQKSMTLLKSLETLVNRKRSNDARDGLALEPHFDEVLGLINGLLDNVKLVSTDKQIPEFQGKLDNLERTDSMLSSGEKELITLSVEILSFIYGIKNSQQPEHAKALLLLDEPDVHLHPDLQYRFVKLLVEAIDGLPITVVIATHSTAILSALGERNAFVHFMTKSRGELKFHPIDKQLRDILPIFGAHPLSNIFTHSPILLVEGEDDERIWQQAVRSSQGKIKIWPCQTGSIDNLNAYEVRTSELISSIYDKAFAFSFRDRDNNIYAIDDIPNVKRARLNCYSVENLILSDDVLGSLETNWDTLKVMIATWLVDTPAHVKKEEMLLFAETFDRKNAKVKGLEVLFLYLIGKSRPWEVIVGQAISKLNSESSQAEGTLVDFLGPRIVKLLELRT